MKTPTKTNRRKRTGDATVCTDTPELKKLQLEEEARAIKARVLTAKRSKGGKKKLPTPRDSSSSDTDSSGNSAMIDNENYLDEPQFLLDDEQIQEDFILVQFQLKKALHYIEKVVGVYGPREFRVKFMRRKGNLQTLFFPDVEDMRDLLIFGVDFKIQCPLN